ncbi:MAG: ACT domain-containing protein [Verrucomicrobia bacterium]|nr:ACT domain-containing protein [Verrucomicrobiota bacterium]
MTEPLSTASSPNVECNPIGYTRPAPTVLELRVRNHPGTMSHITGLFARRAFNLDAIVCAPEGGGETSRMLLLVADEPRLEQVERQLAKLHDVLSVDVRVDLGPAFFTRLFAAKPA